MKKMTALLLACSMVLCVISGCSSSPKQSSSAGSPSSSPAPGGSSEPGASKTYKVGFSNVWVGNTYGVQSVNNASRPNWKTQVNDLLLKIYSGELTLEQGLEAMQKQVDEAKAP